MKTPKLDETKLTREQRKQLEDYKNTQEQLRSLSDIADMTQEVVSLLGDQNDNKDVKNLGVLLVDIKESMSDLNKKENPKFDNSPVVKAVKDVKKAVSGIDIKPEFKPNISVDAPKVNVNPPNVDLKGVEKLLKVELPKIFNKLIGSIPETPVLDLSPLLDKLDAQMEVLQSIDTASRMKPQAPVRVQATNPDGSNIVDAGKLVTEKFDYVDIQQTSSTVETYVYKLGGSGGTTVATVVMTYTDSTKSDIDTMVKT